MDLTPTKALLIILRVIVADRSFYVPFATLTAGIT